MNIIKQYFLDLIAVFIIAWLASEQFNIPPLNIDKLSDIVSIIITFVTTLTGFLSTCLFFFIGFSNTKLGVLLKDNNMWQKLLNCMLTPIVNGILIILFMIIMLFNIDQTNIVNIFWIIFILLYSLIFVLKFIYCLIILVQFNKAENKLSNPKLFIDQ